LHNDWFNPEIPALPSSNRSSRFHLHKSVQLQLVPGSALRLTGMTRLVMAATVIGPTGHPAHTAVHPGDKRKNVYLSLFTLNNSNQYIILFAK
jgi:hypothetical protein